MIITEKAIVISYLKKRGLVSKYLKAKNNILQDNFRAVDLKKRRPHTDNIWYFRINKKYRALAEKIDDKLYVFYISDHQN